MTHGALGLRTIPANNAPNPISGIATMAGRTHANTIWTRSITVGSKMSFSADLAKYNPAITRTIAISTATIEPAAPYDSMSFCSESIPIGAPGYASAVQGRLHQLPMDFQKGYQGLSRRNRSFAAASRPWSVIR